MPRIRFTQNIQRHVPCPEAEVSGATAREVLDNYFAQNERARSYVLNDQGAVRHHMVVFVNGAQIRDKDRLSDPVAEADTVDVMQALSGG